MNGASGSGFEKAQTPPISTSGSRAPRSAARSGIDERDGDLPAPVLADGPLLVPQQRLGFSLQFPGHRVSVPRALKVGRAAAPSLRLGRGLGGGAAARPREAGHRYEDADDARDL